ncbi:MAG: hypothetical protein KGL46_13090 [Hyphomicrobiales bacterium]|nr:hypothetical protein [Hyphomicrobiales bacterium]
MLRILLRFVALLLLAAGFAALVIDGSRSIGSNAFSITPLGETLASLFPGKFNAVDSGGAGLWKELRALVLAAPSWLALGVLGGALFLLTRKRRPKVGYSSR